MLTIVIDIIKHVHDHDDHIYVTEAEGFGIILIICRLPASLVPIVISFISLPLTSFSCLFSRAFISLCRWLKAILFSGVLTQVSSMLSV